MSENPGFETRAGKLSFPYCVLGNQGYKLTRTWKDNPREGGIALGNRAMLARENEMYLD